MIFRKAIILVGITLPPLIKAHNFTNEAITFHFHSLITLSDKAMAFNNTAIDNAEFTSTRNTTWQEEQVLAYKFISKYNVDIKVSYIVLLAFLIAELFTIFELIKSSSVLSSTVFS